MSEAVVDNTGGSVLPAEPAAPAAPPPLTNPTPIVEGDRDTSDDELREALRVARAGRPAEEGDDDAPPPAAAASPPVAKPDTAQAEPPVDPKIAAQVEAAVRARAEQNEARERELRQYREQGSRIVQEAEAYAAQRKQQADAEYNQALAELRKDPLAAMKKAGWDPVQVVENIANYDTPQGRIERELLAIKADNQSLRQELTQRSQAEAQAKAQADQAAKAQRTANEFLAELKSKFPGAEEHLSRPGMQDFYLQQAHRLADEIALDPARNGAPLTYAEVAERLASTYGFGQAPTPPKGAPAQTQAGKAARGLTQTAMSERSGADTRKFHELSPAEQDRILLEEQRERTRQQRAQQR